MSKVSLVGLDVAVKLLNNTIKIKSEESQYNNKKTNDIKIEICNKDERVIDSLTTSNLVNGLIVCSNYFLSESMEQDAIKNYKTKLEKSIKNGATVKIDMFKKDMVRLAVNVDGRDKFNFYGKKVIELIESAESLKIDFNNSLQN